MDAAAKREAIQAIMKDTSLTAKEKQQKMLELNKAAAKTTPTPTAQTNGTSKAAEPETTATGDAQRDAIQAIMKDSSLTALERQAKIQAVMKGGSAGAALATTTEAPLALPESAPSTTAADRKAIQSILRHDSWDPRTKQEKIKEAMGTSSPAATNGTPAAAASSTTTSSEPSKSNQARQELVQSLMKDTSLTAQEKQKRIKAITARATGPTRGPEPAHNWGSPSAAMASTSKQTKQEAAKAALDRYSFGSPTAMLTAKIEADKQDEVEVVADPRLSFGSPTAALAAKKEEPAEENKDYLEPEAPPPAETKEDKAKAALAARMSMGALSPSSVLLSATPSNDDFSHIRRPGNDQKSSRPDPKGNRKSTIAPIGVPKPKPDAPAPAAAPKPKQPAPPTKAPATKANVAAGSKSSVAVTKQRETVPLAHKPAQVAARSSVAVTKEHDTVPTIKKDMTKGQAKPESIKEEKEENREPISTSRALPGLSETPAAPAAVSRGAPAPKGILKKEPEPGEGGCCVIQ